ncbi:hypothetical protein RJT34_18427 [Clitoria ternatea]|uniref:Uncharacterized protein n=1 Tax=Clitoria ternatea TaxID=43366 RepID=A0AAN9PE98_CLITE
MQCNQSVRDVIKCLNWEPDELPNMGEVEVQLEHALSLQQEADATNTNGFYALSSTTLINLGWPQESNSTTSICCYSTEQNDIEDLGE